MGQNSETSSTILLLSLCASLLSSVAFGIPKPDRTLPDALVIFSLMLPPADVAESLSEANIVDILLVVEKAEGGGGVVVGGGERAVWSWSSLRRRV